MSVLEIGRPIEILSVSEVEEDVIKSYGLRANCCARKRLDLDQFVRGVKPIGSSWLTIVKAPPEGRGH